MIDNFGLFIKSRQKSHAEDSLIDIYLQLSDVPILDSRRRASP